MGIWSCIGTSLDEVRDSLYSGKSGIIVDQNRKDLGFRSGLVGYVPKPELKPLLSRSARSFMHEEAQYAYMATCQALQQAAIDADYLEQNEVGIIYGNDSVVEANVTAVDKFRQLHDSGACGSGAIFQSMNSTVSMNLACLFKLKGINQTVSAACASGSQSIGMATMLIRQGLQDCIICGGAEETNLYGVVAFDGIQSFSIHEDNPAKASRPFDRHRDGLVPSGGAATLVLESYDHAVRRGARILAEVAGWGFSGNGDHISTPNIEGPVRAMTRSIQDAGVTPTDIGYINAHATSTIIGDQCEAESIAQVFGRNKIPVTSTKSQTGHEMWMSGASEIIYSILMMKNGFIAGNINFEEPDDVTACLDIVPETREKRFDLFLSNSFGFGGTNSTLIIKDIE
jgi:3-oxoacyl-[acyl-carrier-protein] synthase-1